MENENSLQHYASPYYDPVKAHEYYMRTRELKGKRSTTQLNKDGKQVWAYTKNEIKTEKAAKVKEEQEKRRQKITQLRARAKATREQISAKLKDLNTQLTEDSSAEKERIDTRKKSDLEDIENDATSQKEKIEAKKTAEIERLMAVEIPSALSKDERAKRVAERNEKIAKLRNDAKTDKAKVSNQSKADKAEVRTDASSEKQSVTEETKEERAANSASAKSERAKVSAELKIAVSAAREAYKAAKENLDSSYEEIYQREFDKIASEYKAVKKSKTKTKSSSSSSSKKSKPLSYYIRK